MENRNKFKLFLPALSAECNNNISLISADIRRVQTFVALFGTENGKVISKKESIYLHLSNFYFIFAENIDRL